MSDSPLRDRMIALTEDSHAMHRAFMDGLDPAERELIGSPEKWMVKDIIAHLTYWQESSIMRMDSVLSNTALPVFPDFQQRNEEAFEARRHLSWDQVRANSEHAFATLKTKLQHLSEMQLTEPKDNPDTAPLWWSVLGNVYHHPATHFAEYYVECGDMARGNALQDQIVAKIGGMGTLRDQGVTQYNVACYYAKTGQKVRALELLPHSLELAPDLVDWSTKDSDLDSLRDEPAYKAIYTSHDQAPAK